MGKTSKSQWFGRLAVTFVCVIAMAGCRQASVRASAGENAEGQEASTPIQAEPTLVIENESELPDTFPRAQYEVRFHAKGGTPPLHWSLEKGALPPGIRFEDNGLLHGQAQHTGEFNFILSAKDAGSPQRAVQKGFILRVRSALTLEWKNEARVTGNRIAGSVNVSNTTPDDMDLTFVVMAVAGNGRATAIGYQHFVLKRGTIAMELPFGETLPNGGYVINVDAVGEVPAKNLIYRERMVTPAALQVTVGP
jgi:hypothetical protein